MAMAAINTASRLASLSARRTHFDISPELVWNVKLRGYTLFWCCKHASPPSLSITPTTITTLCPVTLAEQHSPLPSLWLSIPLSR